MTVLGAVLLAEDDPEAPQGCAGLRTLRGAAVLRWSAAALVDTGLDRVLVVTPPPLASAAGHAVRGLPVEVVPAPGPGHGHRLRTVLRLAVPAPQENTLVVLHDPLYPLAPGALVARLGAALLAADPSADAAVPVHPLTETVKRVTPDGLVHETVDRAGFVVTATPQAYRAPALLAALEQAADVDLWLADPASLPDLLLRRGDRVLPVEVDDLGPRVLTADALDRVAAALA